MINDLPLIFGGKQSIKLWKRINKTKPRKLRRLLYEMGCKSQELEVLVRKEKKND